MTGSSTTALEMLLMINKYTELLMTFREKATKEQMNKAKFILNTYGIHNAIDYIKKCISSIIKFSINYDYEIIVIDNNSKLETRRYLSDLYKKGLLTKYIENKENILLTRAQNQGLGVASGSFVLFLNPDTEIFSDDWRKN